jgi:3-methyl-2-oxobutanoate hydroxymethyltransferase
MVNLRLNIWEPLAMSIQTQSKRITALDILDKKKKQQAIVVLTAYDYGTAKLIDQAGCIDIILVGDSLGMVALGYEDTLSVTMEDMLHHVKAVSRGAKSTMVVADMPFMSYHLDINITLQNAGRFIQEGRAQAVKLEGATPSILKGIGRLVQTGIPVMGHLGLTPQAIHTLGGYKLQAKTEASADRLVQDALALEQAGAFAVVLEMVPQEAAAMVSQALSIPTIGIGAGPHCDGQVLVTDDLIGKFPDFKPKFVRQYMPFAELFQQALMVYAQDVKASRFPSESESVITPLQKPSESLCTV